MSEKLHRHGDDLGLGHTRQLPSTGTPGKTSLTSKLFRRPIINVYRATERDDNGVAAGADEHVERASGSSGSALPAELRDRFEASLGADLSGVRIHTGAESQTAAGAVGAKAYAVGNDIHFGAGQYDPSSHEGVFLIAHEVAHTVQQAGATPTRQHKLEVSAPQDSAEVDADRAAEAMVAGASYAVGGAPKAIARKLSSEDKKVWDAQKGDDTIAAVKSAVAAWEAFRLEPTSHAASKAIPGSKAANDLVSLISGAKNFQAHAAAELGGEALVALTEMASFVLPGFVNLGGVLPGVTVKAAGHSYTMTKSGSLTNSIPMLPVSSVTMTYRNALGWSWTRDFNIAGFTISANGKGLSAGGGVDVKVDATSSPPLYRGFEDFDGGAVSVTGGKATIQGAGTATTGSVIKIANNGLNTDFDVKLKVTPSAKPSKDPINISIGQGLGVSFSDADTTVTTPDIVSGLVPVQRKFGPYKITAFETGKADVDPGRAMDVLDKLRRVIQELHDEMAPDREELKKHLGHEPDVRLQVRIEGYASRKWETARDDAERLKKNEELSQARADSTLAILRDLGSEHQFSAMGFGAAIRGEYPPGSFVPGLPPPPPPEPISEGANPAEVKATEAAKAGTATGGVDYSSKSNDDEARAVWIHVDWQGYKLGGTYGKSTTQTVKEP